MFFLEKPGKRIDVAAKLSELKWTLILDFTLAVLLITGCDFLNQLSDLGGNVADMIGRSIGGG